MDTQKRISFSPPDITQAEIDEVVDALKSGWITTGPKTKQLECNLAEYVGTSKVACLNSATAALECGLRLLGIGPGDEVITSAYTYTASASAVCHVGATPVLCDVAPDSFEMDYGQLEQHITTKTRAIIPIDIAGRMVDYDALHAALDDATSSWKPANEAQERFARIPILADAAHSLGARRHGLNAGQAADLTAFSFHAVKNFTTAEGGALTWNPNVLDDEDAYKQVMLMSLHGQTKDALAKDRAGAWEYDIAFPGWKCNMTDMQAGLGLAQLRRYPDLLARRRELVELYEAALDNENVTLLEHYKGDPDTDGFASSGHLMLVRLNGKSRMFRDALIEQLAQRGVASNVHYKPLPMLTAYKNLGFDIADFPNALALFENEITLPLHTLLSDDDVAFICASLISSMQKLEAEGVA
ncbi:MAG: DegT/DnrJ/EryC1/StrS family aminotransferase [Eggerthellaceae bacterium]|nr:DegT/DnrJ/EryC1/StrS family aminotransferase [Eggerthellaceae bacterium]